ncbi:GumC family protein [Notoacmeibacter sp. MSK16QG-6]|uniref:GumC family protein n=1 Tax=Notoacmeibacter sp. MSK16QG-6 TaxID=2957982 RepID=UPI0020A00C53|nr:Wzz/FepE/Etk N-terminal domain-containing protein [Notoacmeibacter sp. MSK16QG-6]MCP1198441.1 Wzz/FepE/Etk N-terminal domain-containing protein [Notoacmeibacter sp. MSK16QG-6]
MHQVSHHDQDVDVDMGTLMGAIWRNWARILIAVLACTALAVFAVILLPKTYMGEARVIVETGESVFTRPNEPDRSALDAEAVESQVALVTSTEVLTNVIERLDLASRPEFQASSLLPFSEPDDDILTRVGEHIAVYRVPNSRVIVIEFTSEDPELAAAGANAVADEYIAVQARAKADSNASATAWLSPEIEELQKRVREAEASVAAYRAEKDIPSFRSDGTLASQQLGDLSAELSRVRAEASDAAAQARSVREALNRGEGLNGLPAVLQSPVVQNLQERRAELASDIAELSARLLDNHPRMRGLRSQLSQLDQQIRTEARKAANALAAEAETARLREQELSDRISSLKAESARVDEEEVGLRALEREASAQRDLLESYLARYRAAQSRDAADYQPVDARIFSRATVPTSPVFPKPVPIVAAALVGSMLLAVVAVLIAELMSGRALRQTVVVSEKVSSSAVPSAVAPPLPRRHDHEAPELVPSEADIAPISSEPEVAVATTAGEMVSVLANTGASRVVFVSPEGDGAAIVGIAIARALADAGLRAILFDLTESAAASRPPLDGETAIGIMDVLADKATLSQVVRGDGYSDLSVVPFGLTEPDEAVGQIDRLPDILEALEDVFDVVLVEAGSTDATGLARLRSENAEIVISVMDADEAEIDGHVRALHDAGFRNLTIATCSELAKAIEKTPEEA